VTVAEAFEEVCECIQARGLALQASKQASVADKHAAIKAKT
jgi:hypothetical protein